VAHPTPTMLAPTPAAGVAVAASVADSLGVSQPRPTTISDLIECTKPGITRLVTITALVGFMLPALGVFLSGSFGDSVGVATGFRPTALDLLITLIGCTLGTAFSAAGANALNMWSERARDACMERTARRPIPSGRVSPQTAFGLGVSLSVIGVVGLAVTAGLLAAVISLTCVLTYLLLYTPMKVTSPMSTLVGAIPGALPPLIGWYAAAHALTPPGSIDLSSVSGGLASLVASPIGHAGGWSLFGLMFVWQMPHFMAIAWKYREHYAAAGYRVLSVGDPDGRRTAASMLRWAILLLPATILPAITMPGTLGPITMVVAIVTGVGYLYLVLEFVGDRSGKRAKAVFLASIMHLPLLLMVMVGEAGLRLVL